MHLNLSKLLVRALSFFILCGVVADGHRHVGISVNGDNVVKTNITTYTIYNKDQLVERELTISCLSLFSGPSTISLSKNGTILNKNSTSTYNTAVTKFTYSEKNATDLHGVYICRFQYLLNTTNGSNFEYFIESAVTIQTTTTPVLCASSIGSLGYYGEKVTLLCKSTHNNLEARFFQTLWLLSQFLQVKLLQNNTFQCGIKNTERSLCTHDFTVLPALKVEISPENFTLSTDVLEFSCNSSPPRLLYWEINGHGGNVLDLTSTGYLLEAYGINITIKQEVGRSFLRVSTSVNDKIDQGIQKVECYAYGTRVGSVATHQPLPKGTSPATHQPLPEGTSPPSGYLCECPLQTITSSLDDDVENPTTTKITSKISTNEDATDQKNTDSKQKPVTCRQCYQNGVVNTGEEEVKKWMIKAVCSFVIALSEALLLLIIVGIWTYRKCIVGNNPSPKSVCTRDIVSLETELQVNPVYQSFDS